MDYDFYYVRYVRLLKNHERYLLDRNKIYRAKKLSTYIYGIYAPSLEIKICEVTLKTLSYCFEKVEM